MTNIGLAINGNRKPFWIGVELHSIRPLIKEFEELIVTCELCKKRYRIKPPTHNGTKHTLTCIQCGYVVRVLKNIGRKENRTLGPAATDPDADKCLPTAHARQDAPVSSSAPLKETESARWPNASNALPRRCSGRWGKIIILFFVVPVSILIGSSLFSLWQLKSLTRIISKERIILTARLAEDKTTEICRAVASQVSLYLKTHPRLHSIKLMQNPVFKRMAVQKVGSNRYTSLYQLSNPTGALTIWAHTDPAMVGKDLKRTHKAALSAISRANYDRFVKILLGVKGLRQSSGSYQIMDSNGAIRREFRVCTPIEGTPYVISVATFPTDFVWPINQFATTVDLHAATAQYLIIFTMAITALVIGVTVFIYGHRPAGPLAQPAPMSDQITLNGPGVKVKMNRKDNP